MSNEMSLSREHLALVCAQYGRLRSSNPILQQLPTNPLWIRWRYLPWQRFRCYGEAQDSVLGATISINPLAFEPSWEIVLAGIIHHEMIHVLMPDEGHNQVFADAERSWSEYEAFRSALQIFREEAERLALDRSIVHIYHCKVCEITIRIDRILPIGTACKHCCIKDNQGKHSHLFSLIYEGREGNNHGQKTKRSTEASNPR